jgi:hypothetical protein
MKSARSTVTGLLVGPALAIGVLAGAAQAAHAAAPAKDTSYAPDDHGYGPGWRRDHDGDREHDWGRSRGWAWDHGWRRDRDWRWHRRHDPRWSDRWDHRRYDPRVH